MAIKDWSETAADNDDADAGINWLEGQAPSTVNGSARSMMAVLKKAVGHTLYLQDYGAVGDGSTDDTTAIQAALNDANSAGGGRVLGALGKTYLVSFVNTKTFNSAAQRYCLLLPDNVILDLNGATLKLDAAQNAAMIMNSSAGSSQNSNLGIANGVLDGNQANQTSPAEGDMPCIWLHNVLRPQVYNIRAKNVRQYAGRFFTCDKGYFNNLHCEDSDGDGWSFGISGSSQHVTNSFIDNIYAQDCTNGEYGSLQGNGFIGCFQYCTIGKVETLNCGGGNKIQDSSIDTTVQTSITRGGAKSTTNSGTKIQGASGLQNCLRISIGQIVSEAETGYGAYFLECSDIQVGSISSYGDGAGGTVEAVQIDSDATNIEIGSVFIEEAGKTGLAINGQNIAIGSAIVKNSGNVTAGQANISIQAAADGVYIGKLVSIENQGTPTADRGLNLISGAKNINIGMYHSKGTYATAGRHLIDNGATTVRLGGKSGLWLVDDTPTYAASSSISTVGNAGAGEDDLLSYSIPARSMFSNGQGYRVRAWGEGANNSNPKTVKLVVGINTLATLALTVSQANQWSLEAEFVRTATSTFSYVVRSIQDGTTEQSVLASGSFSQTESSAITVKCTGTVTNGGGGINDNDVTQKGLIVEPLT